MISDAHHLTCDVGEIWTDIAVLFVAVLFVGDERENKALLLGEARD